MNQVMEAGALGCEIVISGKLRTERARFEKFRAGYFPRCGEPALKWTRKTEAHVQLKAGMFGVRVKIMPPDAQFPDKIKILTELPLAAVVEKKPESVVLTGKAEAPEKIVVVEGEKKAETAAPVPPAEAPIEAPIEVEAKQTEETPKPVENKSEEAKP